MARIKKELMEERISALQDVLDEKPEGMTVMEMVEALKARGVALPASEYQGVNIILKKAAADGILKKEGKKWLLVDEGEEVVDTPQTTAPEASAVAAKG